MSGRIGPALRLWLVVAVAVTAMTGLVYLAVQQAYRMSANDPQIQLAEDSAARLAAGAAPADVVGTGTVEIGPRAGAAGSLAPFVVVYDAAGAPVAGTGRLDGALPRLPAGVFAFTRTRGEDRVTWQPRPGIRIAAVVTLARGGATAGSERFVLAGRSLREVERRVDDLGGIALLAWLATLAATFVAAVMAEYVGPPRS